jgi:tRNA pseudouridine synthase 10
MRFFGVGGATVYNKPIESLKETIASEAQDKPEWLKVLNENDPSKLCISCLGLLRDGTGSGEDTWAESVVKEIVESGHETATLCFSLSLPPSLAVREHSLQHFLTTTFDENSKVERPIIDLKEVMKWSLTKLVVQQLPDAKFSKIPNDPSGQMLDVQIKFDHDSNSKECDALGLPKEKPRKSRKRRLQGLPKYPAFATAAASVIVKHLSDARGRGDLASSTIPCPPESSNKPCTLETSLSRSPIFIMGRYNKFQRGLPQTPWWIGTTRFGETSVEEEIAKVFVPCFKPASYKFHSGGREDIDVRMLGNGRPFALELIDSKLTDLPAAKWAELEAGFNEQQEEALQVKDMRVVPQETCRVLKTQAENKRRCYCCVIWVSKTLERADVAKLNAVSEMQIVQKTPVRVLHRRALIARTRIIHSLACEYINQHFMLVRMVTSSGTYVKEFIHGDRGRTVPNIGSMLGCQADILQLDVESLQDDEDQLANSSADSLICRAHQNDRQADGQHVRIKSKKQKTQQSSNDGTAVAVVDGGLIQLAPPGGS